MGSFAISGIAIGSTVVVSPTQALAQTSNPVPTESSCEFGNPNVHHVIQVTFDNVHFNRDNPNVLSDMEQIPALTNFIEGNGTMLSNNHTPLIAHTGNDTVTDYTGLYGDRNGVGISNDYETYNGTGGVDSAATFAYWTSPLNDTTQYPSPDPLFNQPYSPTDPPTTATTSNDTNVPAPWVNYTRAGCDVGEVATANSELENPVPDIATAFGQSSPEEQQVANDSDSYKDQETADYVGVAVHCAKSSTFCSTAQAVKYGQTTASPTAVPDLLPTEPGGYSGFQALFGHKYLQPQLASIIAAEPGATTTGGAIYDPNGYQVTNSSGDLVDLFGNEMIGDYVSTPGFPGYGGITAAQSLAYAADMQEAGVPITYAYISDAHEKKYYPSGYENPGQGSIPANTQPPACTTGSSSTTGLTTGYGLAPGDPCYTYNLTQWNEAFNAFFTRLAADGITPANTLFVFTADEGDHFNGADAGRAIDVTSGCTGTADTTSYTCTYARGQVGEVDVNVHSLLASQASDTTSFYNEPQGDVVYVNNQPSPTDPTTRTLERDFGSLQIVDPYDGSGKVPVANYMADQEEEQLLHYVTADPSRTPTFTVFPNSDVYMSSGTSDTCSGGTNSKDSPTLNSTYCEFLNPEYLWDHGYYAPEIDNTWLGLVGPGIANLGLNGSPPSGGPNSAGPTSGEAQLDTSVNNPGIWVDHTDVQPTIMADLGFKDDYTPDGRVITEVLTNPPATTQDPNFLPLATCYKQLYSSVGDFGTDTLLADTNAIESGTSGDDSTYTNFLSQLTSLGDARTTLADTIKQELFDAEFNGVALPASVTDQITQCRGDIVQAATLADVTPPTNLPESPFNPLLPILGVGVVALFGTWVIRHRRASATAA